MIDGEVTQDALDDWVRDGVGEEEQMERWFKVKNLRERTYARAHLSLCESCDNEFHLESGDINVRMLDETITGPGGHFVCTVCSLCQRRPDIRDQLRRDPLWELNAARQVLWRLEVQAMLEPLVRQIDAEVQQERRNARGDQLRENDEPDQ